MLAFRLNVISDGSFGKALRACRVKLTPFSFSHRVAVSLAQDLGGLQTISRTWSSIQSITGRMSDSRLIAAQGRLCGELAAYLDR